MNALERLTTLETSAKNSLKEREILQVEIVKLNTEKLVNGLALQLQSELSTMRQDMQSLKSENESLRSELKKEREARQRLTKISNESVKRIKELQSRSLWDQIKDIFRS